MSLNASPVAVVIELVDRPDCVLHFGFEGILIDAVHDTSAGRYVNVWQHVRCHLIFIFFVASRRLLYFPLV